MKKDPAAIIVKFTTWRHRTMLYRSRELVNDKLGYKVTLDITRENIVMMNGLRNFVTENNIETVEYIFCDINCQPTIKMKDNSFLRFDTIDEGKQLLRIEEVNEEEDEEDQ